MSLYEKAESVGFPGVVLRIKPSLRVLFYLLNRKVRLEQILACAD